ncbi:winged helix-turn-helix domain-containing protein [Sphingomonas sp. LT1P40]|uniref:winged helix-turn-helix domain-containing protein n=1 Tax=Alteristakelama amylovorans TaxID=3096166 RepID=UPI002FC92B9C
MAAFDRFILDAANRQLLSDTGPVELNARYFDALALLVSEAGQLVTKDRFLETVWRGVPVTDEALTQCIRTLRRQLGDDATNPRFIETVPKHGYRFIAPLEAEQRQAAASEPPAPDAWRRFAPLAGAGTLGAGLAGAIGGLFYGFGGAAQPLQPGTGATSVVIVLFCVTLLMAVIGGAGVSFGIAAARIFSGRAWMIVGGAAGGMIVGGIVKLLGLDAFNLLFGQSLGNFTGAGEGALLGAAVGIGAWATDRIALLRRAVAIAALAGGTAGVGIVLIGGRLLGGSLALLAAQFPNSRLRLDQIGALFGEEGFGPVSQAATGGLEGALFAGCIVGGMLLANGLNARDTQVPR